MLDEESLQAYKSIHLTRDLRGEILARHTEKRTSFRYPQLLRPAAALCSVILIAAVLLIPLLKTEPGIYTDGGRITAEARTAVTESVPFTGGLMRASIHDPSAESPQKTAECCIPLRLSYKETVTVSVSGGALLLPIADGDYVYAGAFGVIENGTSVYWSLDGCEDVSPLTAEIFSEDGILTDTVTLTYDAADGIWLIANTMSEK